MERGHKDFSVHRLEDKPNKRCRRWLLVTCDGTRYKNGALKKKRTQFEGSYTEAMSEAERLAGKRKRMVDDESWTFEAYARHWNDSRRAIGLIEKTTHSNNDGMISMIARHIGDIELCDIKPRHIEDAYVRMRAGDTRSGRQLCGTTLECVHNMGKTIFDYALRDGLVDANPFAMVDRPRKDTKEKRALMMAEEVELSLMLDSTNRYHLAIILMMECGLRRGEVCALTWGDISESAIVVSKSMKYDCSIGKTKNKKSRIVPLSNSARVALETYRQSQREALASRFMEQDDEMLVMANEFGDPTNPTVMSQWWKRRRGDFGLDDFTLHQFRHTFCTNLAEANIHPKIMQKLMGHSSERITMQVYSHVNDEQMFGAIEAMDSAKRTV